ncbi:hypothetical protein CASFOL_020483 [Castilleja foliolosa]|uniref:Uncharacterized protein n=1 Tax=Castilleja foliolosa TaxID=1961234 RepID=A0ABD3D4K4_9LAMI
MLFEGFPEKCDALRMMRSNLMERVSSVRLLLKTPAECAREWLKYIRKS